MFNLPCLLMLVLIKCLLLYTSITSLIHQKSCQLIDFKNIQVAIYFYVSIDQVPFALLIHIFIKYSVNQMILISKHNDQYSSSHIKCPLLYSSTTILILHKSCQSIGFNNTQVAMTCFESIVQDPFAP